MQSRETSKLERLKNSRSSEDPNLVSLPDFGVWRFSGSLDLISPLEDISTSPSCVQIWKQKLKACVGDRRVQGLLKRYFIKIAISGAGVYSMFLRLPVPKNEYYYT
jgi:hypothetical protein